MGRTRRNEQHIIDLSDAASRRSAEVSERSGLSRPPIGDSPPWRFGQTSILVRPSETETAEIEPAKLRRSPFESERLLLSAGDAGVPARRGGFTTLGRFGFLRRR
ncbi:MAG: hypothetical protein R2733_26870 [Acidimicrobiales bacterium]